LARIQQSAVESHSRVHHEMSCQTDVTGEIAGQGKSTTKLTQNLKKLSAKNSTLKLSDVTGPMSVKDKPPAMSSKDAVSICADILANVVQQHETDKRKGKENKNFSLFIRDNMIRRFGIKVLATKHLRSLVDVVARRSKEDKLFRIIGELTNASLKQGGIKHINNPTAAKQALELVVKFLGILINLQSKLKGEAVSHVAITNCLGNSNRSWDRVMVLEGVHIVFSFFRAKEPENYKKLINAIMKLPVIEKDVKDKSKDVMLDEVLMIIIKYSECEFVSQKSQADAFVTALKVPKLKAVLKKVSERAPCDRKRSD